MTFVPAESGFIAVSSRGFWEHWLHCREFVKTLTLLGFLFRIAGVLWCCTQCSTLAHAQEEEEWEVAPFDIYVSDTLIGATAVQFRTGEARIESPKDVVEQLNITKGHAELTKLFSEVIRGSSELPSFGKIEIDDATFRIIITLDPSLLKSKELALEERLASPDASFSLQQSVNTSVATTLGESADYSLNTRTLLGLGLARAHFDGTLFRDSDFEIVEGLVSTNVDAFEISGGMLRTSGMTFAQSSDIFGIGLRTAEEVFLDQDALIGSKLEIFIPIRSRVRFYREGRLLSVQLLEYGLQSVDTSAFPQGSYFVDIVIEGDNGQEQTERRFFSKSNLLGIRSRPLISAQVGAKRDALDIREELAYQLGIQWRALSALQLKGNIAGSDDFALSGVEFLTVYEDFILGLGSEYSTDGDLGLQARFDGTIAGFNWSVSGLKTIQGFDQEPTDAEELPPTDDEQSIIDRFIGRPRGGRGTLSGKRTEVSGQALYSFGDFDLRFIVNMVDSETLPLRKAIGPRVDWRVYDNEGHRVTFQLGGLDTERGEQVVGYLAYTFTSRPWNSDTRVNINGTKDRKQISAVQSTTYDNKTLLGSGERARVLNSVSNPEGSNNRQFADNLVEVDHTNTWTAVNGFLRDTRGTTTSSSNVGINGRSSIVVSQDGRLTVAPPSSTDALFIADIESTNTNTEVEIVVDGQVYAKIRAGERAVLPLMPFRKYKALVRPAETSELFTTDSDVFPFVLFPGNIVRHTWKVTKVAIVIGKIVDDQGNPLRYKRLKGARGFVITEEDGSFQAELSGSEKLTLESPNGECQITLPSFEGESEIIDLDEIQCIVPTEDDDGAGGWTTIFE